MKKLLLVVLGLFVFSSTNAQTPIAPQSSQQIESSHVFCSQACRLYSFTAQIQGTAGSIMLFDAKTVPADGNLTTSSNTPPLYCWNISASSYQSYVWSYPAQFNNGLIAVFSTGNNCLYKTASATAFFTAQAQ